MIVNLRESKARLSELVELANRGEDVLITVHGKVKARLTRATGDEGPVDMERRRAWVEELRELRQLTTGCTLTVEEILDDLREDRV